MTANIMVNDKKVYAERGMIDCIGKPFTSQELWSCLMRYFEPIFDDGAAKSDKSIKPEVNDVDKDDGLQKALKLAFAKDNQNKVQEIANHIENGDLKIAHRLAHTLRGTSALIGEKELHDIATEVESLLKNEENRLTDAHMQILDEELQKVLQELAPLLASEQKEQKEQMQAKATSQGADEIFNKLEPLLKTRNPGAHALLDDLRAIPGTTELIEQVEKYDFKLALMTLQRLRTENN